MRNHLSSVAFTLLTLAIAVPAAEAKQAIEILNNTNVLHASNGASLGPTFTLTHSTQITEIWTYHWNNGQGAQPGTISVRDYSGKTWGPFSAQGSGQGNSRNVNWKATLNLVLPAGNYNVLDSDPITWSQNKGSSGQGFTRVYGFIKAPLYPPPPPFFKPCNPSNNPIALVGPCVAQRGGLIWVQKLHSGITPLMLEFVRVAPQNTTPAIRLIGSGTSTIYTFRVSDSLCAPATPKTTVSYHVFLIDTTGLFQGFIGSFTPDCR